MEYIKTKDKIIIENNDEFLPEHIIECGQVFRYKKIDNGYLIFSSNKQAKVIENCGKFEIISSDIDYFENYFDLKNDYSKIKDEILKIYQKNSTKKDDEFLKNAIEFGKGIRILNQDSVEMIISFLISQNNNIKRIQLIVEKLCEKFGENMGEYYAFPSIKALGKITEQEFKNLGLGYRASYMVEVVKFLKTFDENYVKNLSTKEALAYLLNVKGIGPKVADCILLFGFHKMDCFPVDVWIEKVYHDYFDNSLNDRVKMRENLTNIFGENSGYAQQYLFYYQRVKVKD